MPIQLQGHNEVEFNEECKSTDLINEASEGEEAVDNGDNQQGSEEQTQSAEPEAEDFTKPSEEPLTSKAEVKTTQRNRFKASSMKITSFSHSFFGKSRDSDKLGDNKKISKDLEKTDKEMQNKLDFLRNSCDLEDEGEILKSSQDSLDLLEDSNEKKDVETSEHESESSESEDNVQVSRIKF